MSAAQRSAGSPLQRPWSRKSDSNRRPVLYKGTALPTELNRHICRAFARLCTRGRTPRGPAATLAVLSNFCGLAMRALLQCLVGGCAIALTVWFGGAPFPIAPKNKCHKQNVAIDVPSGSEPKPALKGALGIQPGRCEATTDRLLTAMYRGIRPGPSSRLRHTGQLRLVRLARTDTGSYPVARRANRLSWSGFWKGARANVLHAGAGKARNGDPCES